MRGELGRRHVVATGGLAGLIAPYSQTIQDVDAASTLEGLRLVWELNARARSAFGTPDDGLVQMRALEGIHPDGMYPGRRRSIVRP